MTLIKRLLATIFISDALFCQEQRLVCNQFIKDQFLANNKKVTSSKLARDGLLISQLLRVAIIQWHKASVKGQFKSNLAI